MLVKNVSGHDRTDAWLGGRLVFSGQEVDVAAALERNGATILAYTEGDLWDPADDEAREAHDAAWAALHPPTREELEGFTVPQLVKHAAATGIDLGGATKKAEILAALTPQEG